MKVFMKGIFTRNIFLNISSTTNEFIYARIKNTSFIILTSFVVMEDDFKTSCDKFLFYFVYLSFNSLNIIIIHIDKIMLM